MNNSQLEQWFINSFKFIGKSNNELNAYCPKCNHKSFFLIQ